MAIEKITEDELLFMESWYNPVCMVESLFSNFDDLGEFDEEQLGDIRLYQRPMLSHEAMIDFDTTAEHHKLKDKQKFALRKNVADLYNLGGRKYGKSMITMKLDIPLSSLYDDKFWTAIYSIDEKKLRGILDPVSQAFNYHPIFKIFNYHCSYRPEIKFANKSNNWKIQGVNMRLRGKAPGEQFYQLHVQKLWGDEVSFETEDVYAKRKESLSEFGAVIRLGGMTNFTRHSPIGKIFYDPDNKDKIINLPQYVNPYWDEKEKEDRLKHYGGESSLNYRIFVGGEIVEDSVSEFDMERVKKCYKEKKEIKHVEIPKDRFKFFKNLIVVERPKNADRMILAMDVGDGAGGSEIIILSEVGNSYNYLYNITLYNLKRSEQLEILKYLIEKAEINVMGLDCGEALGRALSDDLELLYKKERVVRYSGNDKIKVGFKLDENGKVILVKGNPVYREEFMSEWSIERLKALLYEIRINIPMDYKFDNQVNGVISTKSGSRKIYACISETGDHLFDAFKVFAITQWLKKDFNETPPVNKDWGTGVISLD